MTTTDRKGKGRAAVLLLGLGLAAATAGPARADHIRWRTDYNAARKEAAEQDKPLLIDFGTENCFYCKKLDASTFLDPQVVGTLNAHFIPLKIDAEREAMLAQALRVQAYPTLVLAGPDGKILAFLEGFLEAPRLYDQMARALQTATTPEWMARDFEESSKAIAAADYGRAITLLKGIGKDGKERGVQVKARQVLLDLEQQATGRLAKAKQLQDAGRDQDAVDALTAVLKSYAGSQAADDASRLLAAAADRPENRQQQRSRRARELLAQAREDFGGRRYMACLDRCELIADAYGGTPESAEAGRLAEEIKGNPELMARACEDAAERLGAMYLTQAEMHTKRGETARAKVCLEKVMKTCAGTPRAEAALVRMSKLKGEETRQAEFSKP